MLNKKLIYPIVSFSLLALPLIGAKPVYARSLADLTSTQVITIEAKEVDPRTVILKDYLAKRKSPLVNNAADFVEAADQYQLDWKLVAAISGVESTFGKHTPGNEQYPSYNGWGWGVYGSQSLGFRSWKHGIYTVSEGLKKDYVDKGLTDPYAMNRKYAASKEWGWKVDFFLKDIESFAQTYPEYLAYKNKPAAKITNQTPNIAGTSAKLSLAK
jgi:hypothetical protein